MATMMLIVDLPPPPPSLGISMLEIACDLELPSGGQNWHCLRNGELPHDFTKGSPSHRYSESNY